MIPKKLAEAGVQGLRNVPMCNILQATSHIKLENGTWGWQSRPLPQLVEGLMSLWVI